MSCLAKVIGEKQVGSLGQEMGFTQLDVFHDKYEGIYTGIHCFQIHKGCGPLTFNGVSMYETHQYSIRYNLHMLQAQILMILTIYETCHCHNNKTSRFLYIAVRKSGGWPTDLKQLQRSPVKGAL